MALLDSLQDPDDVRKVPANRLDDLAAEIRAFLIKSVCRSGGHLGPNLGVVELTIAVHRVLHSPQTPIISDGPTVLRYPKAVLGDRVPALARMGGVDLLRTSAGAEVLVVATGALCTAALAAADLLADEGITCTVIDPRWVLPPAPVLAELAAEHQLVVTIEDGLRVGGIGSHLSAMLADAGVGVPVRNLGLPAEFIPQGTRAELLPRYGLDADGIAASIRSAVDAGGQVRGERRLGVLALQRSAG